MQQFLHDRSLDYLLSGFIVNKIDDSVCSKCSDSKLLELGLAYGDLLSFRSYFQLPESSTTQVKSYEERAKILKDKLKRSHTDRVDSRSRPVTVKSSYNVSFGLKCMENQKYTLKLNKGFNDTFDRTSSYSHLHNVCREYFKIPEITETYLGYYNGSKIETSFLNLERFALKQKNKKKGLHLYLFYPLSYAKLQLKCILSGSSINTADDSSDNIDDILPDFLTIRE